MLCLVVLIRDEGDRLEPICLQSVAAVQLLRWAKRFESGETDPCGRYEAAHSFVYSLLPRAFFHALVAVFLVSWQFSVW